MTLELTGRFYDKQIGRAMLTILFQQLNDKLDEMEADWNAEDEEFWTAINKGIPDWNMEPVADGNFHEGASPPYINAPIENFPSVYVFCHQGTPTGSSDDTGELYAFTVDVELMASSGPFTGEYNEELAEQASMRLGRLQEGVNLVILENRRLGGIVTDINAPAMSKGQIFPKRGAGGKGPSFYWQGGVIRYVVHKWVKML